MYNNRLTGSLRDLFNKDQANQIKEWSQAGERVVLLMDINDNPLDNNYTKS